MPIEIDTDNPGLRVVNTRFATAAASLDILVTFEMSDGSETKILLDPDQASAVIGRLLFVGRQQHQALGLQATKAAPKTVIPLHIDHLASETGDDGRANLWLTIGPQTLATTVDLNSLIGLCEWLTVLLGGKPSMPETPLH